ncbi:DMT family transporter [Vibrio sp. RC27]
MNTQAVVTPIRLFGHRIPIMELMLLMVALFWGTSYGMTKEALSFTNVFIFIAIRFCLTFLSLLPKTMKDTYAGLNNDWRSALPGGVILSAIFVFEVYGVLHTSAAKAAFIISLSVILTALLEPLINRKSVSRSLLAMTFLSVVGVLCLTTSSPWGDNLSFNLGDGLILVAAILRALMVTTTKRFTHNKKITTTTLTAIQSGVVSIMAAIGVTLSPIGVELPSEFEFWLIMGYLVIFCTLFAFYAQNYAVRRVSPTRVSLLMGSEPLFGALFAVVWLNETLTMLQGLGGMLIFISVMVTSLRKSD